MLRNYSLIFKKVQTFQFRVPVVLRWNNTLILVAGFVELYNLFIQTQVWYGLTSDKSITIIKQMRLNKYNTHVT